MDTNENTFQNLFQQLGLDTSETAIAEFIKTHQLKDGIALHKAPYWTDAQAQFLRESYVDDADWVVVIDQLNTALRKDEHQ